MVTHDSQNRAMAEEDDAYKGLEQAPSRWRSSAQPDSLEATSRVYSRAVATPFGVRVDYLAADDEPLYSEYLPNSSAVVDCPGASGRWGLAVGASVLSALLGFAVGLLAAM
jgi:hypothetical protein